jgi:DNA-directed RNA polymerase I subunit RPA2
MKKRGGLARANRRVPSYTSGVYDESSLARLRHLRAAHVESFNYFLAQGMHDAVADMSALDMRIEDGPYVRMVFTSIRIGSPVKKDDGDTKALIPREARERGLSYTGTLVAEVTVTVGENEQEMNFACPLGDLPIMVLSDKCSLAGLSPEQLVSRREEALEMGGYFIVNGIERIVRLLQVPRRNHATAIERSSYRNRGASYSDRGVAMRCVRPDQSSITITLHYLDTGAITLRLVIRKQEFLLPVVLVAKALGGVSDREIFDRVLQLDRNNTFMAARLELLLRDTKRFKVDTISECRAYLGHHFRGFLPISERYTDVEAGEILINKYLFVHANKHSDKLECLLHMMRKLLTFAQDGCFGDNTDALMNHELLLPGHLFSMFIREKLEELLLGVRIAVAKDARINKDKCLVDLTTVKYFAKHFERLGSSLGNKAKTFLSTGNLVSQSGMDLMQVSGFTVVAERLNTFRYLSHFQSVHRGQFFTTMKTTTVRKLLPESWGFLCPVHTPDGSPCGLLNHLARDSLVVAFPTCSKLPLGSTGRVRGTAGEWLQGEAFKRLLVSLGVVPASVGGLDGQLVLGVAYISVLLDGVVVGGVRAGAAAALVTSLRQLKVAEGDDGLPRVDPTLEVALIPRLEHKGAFPGLYLFTQPGRMLRAARNLATGRIELIGPMEQVYLDIACLGTHFCSVDM